MNDSLQPLNITVFGFPLFVQCDEESAEYVREELGRMTLLRMQSLLPDEPKFLMEEVQ